MLLLLCTILFILRYILTYAKIPSPLQNSGVSGPIFSMGESGTHGHIFWNCCPDGSSFHPRFDTAHNGPAAWAADIRNFFVQGSFGSVTLLDHSWCSYSMILRFLAEENMALDNIMSLFHSTCNVDCVLSASYKCTSYKCTAHYLHSLYTSICSFSSFRSLVV